MKESSLATGTMNAIVKQGSAADSVQLAAIPRPVATEGFAVVNVLATGICGTDIHVRLNEYANEPPVVMGHEVIGVVASVGSTADEGWVGRKVVCETYFSTCERCQWCRAGRRNLCPNRRSIGSFENGGFAEALLIPTSNLHAVPDNAPGISAVLSEPLACVAQCLLDPPTVNSGDRVLVTGPGAMGQLSAQVARSQGGVVTLAGLPKDADRLRVAESLGFTTTTSTPEPDSFDVVIECSGSAFAASAAFAAVKRGGRYVQVGIFGRPIELPLDLVLYKELSVTSGFASTPTSWRRAIELIEQGKVTLEPLVTASVPIESWEDAFASAAAGEGIKTVIVPR